MKRALVIFACFVSCIANGAGLSGSLQVHQESDTAADAKIKATNASLRQVLFDVVSKYSDVDALRVLMNNSKDADLINFVTSSSVANEQISMTGYSAKITWNFDNDLIKNYLIAFIHIQPKITVLNPYL